MTPSRVKIRVTEAVFFFYRSQPIPATFQVADPADPAQKKSADPADPAPKKICRSYRSRPKKYADPTDPAQNCIVRLVHTKLKIT